VEESNPVVDELNESLSDQTTSGSSGTCRPFVKWAGGKRGLLTEIIRRLPPSFNRYMEPFLGGGAVFFALSSRPAFLADSNGELVISYEAVRDECEELISLLSTYEHSEEEFYRIRALDRAPDFASLSRVERAARLIYLNKTCFNGLYRVNAKGFFNVPFGRYENPKICDAANLKACSQKLSRAVLSVSSFEHVLEVAEKGDFVYFDPPYAPVSKTSDFTSYVPGGFDDAAQELLMLVCLQLHQRGVQWILSNSNVPLIHELYRGFRIEQVYAPRAINSKASGRGAVTELLIRNY
jgi:DNA adenine methylase